MQELNNLRFSKPESFQLVMTGLKYLRAYERTAEQESLDRATEVLARGMRMFPDDIAPKFYLGIAKAVSGAKNADEAVALLTEIDQLHIEKVRFQVKYNLAAAHAGTYREANLKEARGLLKNVLDGISEAETGSNRVLRRQAEALVIYLDIRDLRERRLAIHAMSKEERERSANSITGFRQEVGAVKRRLENFKSAFEKESAPEHEREEILADYWNDMGIVEWYLAESHNPGEFARREHGEQAINLFQESLQHKQAWPPPRTNMAMVYHDIFDDLAKAEQLWRAILKTECARLRRYV